MTRAPSPGPVCPHPDPWIRSQKPLGGGRLLSRRLCSRLGSGAVRKIIAYRQMYRLLSHEIMSLAEIRPAGTRYASLSHARATHEVTCVARVPACHYLSNYLNIKRYRGYKEAVHARYVTGRAVPPAGHRVSLSTLAAPKPLEPFVYGAIR